MARRSKKGIAQDKKIKAKHAGKRESADGNIYYENRPNRSDENRTLKFKKGGQTKAGIKQDKNIKALHAGKRESADGNVYYENRPNRSDKNRTKKFKKGGQTKAGIAQDKNIKALHAGKRESADGNIYYENRPNRSDKNRSTKLANGGSLHSLSTKDLAAKAGITVKDMEDHNLHRDDLLAILTDGNYEKGGSFWDKVKSKSKTAYDKTKAGTKEAYDKSKKYVNDKVHDQKKKVALEVIDDTKDKVSDNKTKMALKAAENIVEEKFEHGGGTKSHEDLVNAKLDSNGEISTEDFAAIIERSPCYPVCTVGESKYRKQFLRGCYRKMGGSY